MDKSGRPAWEIWATRLVSAASIGAVIYFVLFFDFSGHGRMWDELAARVPVLAKIIPPESNSSGPRFTKSGPARENFNGDRTLIVADQAPAAVPSPTTAAPAAAATAEKAAGKQMVAPHLTTSLTPFDISNNSPSETISVPGQAARQPARVAAAPAAAPSAAAPAPTQNAASPSIAAKASYGAASRSEMMGQAAGPVYNLKGK